MYRHWRGRGPDVFKDNVASFLFHSGVRYSEHMTGAGNEEKEKKV